MHPDIHTHTDGPPVPRGDAALLAEAPFTGDQLCERLAAQASNQCGAANLLRVLLGTAAIPGSQLPVSGPGYLPHARPERH